MLALICCQCDQPLPLDKAHIADQDTVICPKCQAHVSPEVVAIVKNFCHVSFT